MGKENKIDFSDAFYGDAAPIIQQAAVDLAECLKKSMLKQIQELQNRCSELETANACLKEELAHVKTELFNKKCELDTIHNAAEQHERDIVDKCKRMRIKELVAPFGRGAWKLSYKGGYQQKCDKCDSNRNIHFYSPGGVEYMEKCSCAKKIIQLVVPEEVKVFDFFKMCDADVFNDNETVAGITRGDSEYDSIKFYRHNYSLAFDPRTAETSYWERLLIGSYEAAAEYARYYTQKWCVERNETHEGPVYDCAGNLIDLFKDGIVCDSIKR